MEHTVISLASHEKLRCGDASGYRFYRNENRAVGIVSDGVSCADRDYLASRLTVDRFFEVFDSEAGMNTEHRLEKAVVAADKKVKESSENGGRRMLSPPAWQSYGTLPPERYTGSAAAIPGYMQLKTTGWYS